VEFCYAGKKPNKYSEVILSAALRGIFAGKTNEPVNYINARYFAEEHGIKISEIKLANSPLYSNSISIGVTYGNGKTKTLLGSVYNDTDGRLVQFDDYQMEIKLEGDLFIYENEDRPGMLAQVGSILAQHSINIGSLVLGRKKETKRAITVLTVDSGLNEQILTEIKGVDGVISTNYVRLIS
jgi:D-3-phosphoglycerate dehydrogenase